MERIAVEIDDLLLRTDTPVSPDLKYENADGDLGKIMNSTLGSVFLVLKKKDLQDWGEIVTLHRLFDADGEDVDEMPFSIPSDLLTKEFFLKRNNATTNFE
jgi:hypothetical protein